MGTYIRIKTNNRNFIINEDMFDYTDEREFKFLFGKSYALVGEFGCGGYSISNILTNRSPIINEEIWIDSKKEQSYPLYNGWLVGQTCYSKCLKKELGLKEILRKHEHSDRYNAIIEYFDVNLDTLHRYVSKMPHEKWRISIAVGLLMEKTIFGFPYMNSRFLYDVLFESGNARSIKKITDYGGIVIIPTSNRELVSPLVDEVIELNNKRFHSLNSFAENHMNRLRLH